MIKIAICDDSNEISSQIENLVHRYSQNIFQIDIYNTSQSIGKKINEGKNEYAIYFLDVEIDEKNGIEIAHMIRKRDINAFIIFITSYKEYMSDVFEVQTFDYILKPITENRLFKLLDKISFLGNFENNKFVYSVNNIKHFVSYGEILYFEKQKRQTILFNKLGREEVFYMNTDGILAQLNESFVQIHTSYIINIYAVKEIGKTKVILSDDSNGEIELPLSRKYRELAYQRILDTFERMI
ncbi:LytR/AlgR family response regulator transcription factor [Candidatus Enterococcus courvalinii]|uniref:Response regulator transcription factor n=1 Tax=Candidatus Enterococcus courvalinii TaxID=2815329 RepID=A0ABS3I202_9ENTE|nr:LytTR family DNA-binding domain-containing protein [Enterococcus sp. MSG2901]MBO0482202.1 response regulator transcription factor [Enterococcus sp. MSG2901]